MLSITTPRPNLLAKSKYSFFTILSYGYSRAEAKILLRRLSQRGKELCNDTYLDILEPLIYSLDIRSVKQIPILRKFSKEYFFDDQIQLEVYLDFKRESDENLQSLVKAINDCSCIENLTIAGTPNQFFTNQLFSHLKTNQSIKSLDVNIEWINNSSFRSLQESLSENIVLERLFLRNCEINNSDLELIIRGMNLNPHKSIKSLGLHDVKLNSEGIKAMTSYLQEINPKNFEELSLSFIQNINEDDLAEMLKNNTSIKKLSMRYCSFENNALGSFDSIMAGIAQHPSMEEIDIQSVKFSAQSIISLSEAIKNTKLKKVIIDSCTSSAI